MEKATPKTKKRQVFEAILLKQGVFTITDLRKVLPHIPVGTISGASSHLIPKLLSHQLIRRDFTRKDPKFNFYESLVPDKMLSNAYFDDVYKRINAKPARNNKPVTTPAPNPNAGPVTRIQVGSTLAGQTIVKINNNTLIEVNIWRV